MMNPLTPIEQRLAEAAHYSTLPHLKWRQIAFLYPILQYNGRNACRVYYMDGSYDDVTSTCMTVLEHMARDHYTTVENARMLSLDSQWCTSRRRVVMLFSEACTIVPLTAVKTLKGNGSRLGYLVKQYLYETQAVPDGTLLKFGPKHEGLHITQHEDTVRQKLQEAALLEREFADKLETLRRQMHARTEARYDEGDRPQIGRYR